MVLSMVHPHRVSLYFGAGVNVVSRARAKNLMRPHHKKYIVVVAIEKNKFDVDAK